MSDTLLDLLPVEDRPDISHLITEDDTPVDNLFSEKQQRLLVDPLYLSWKIERPFLAAANVGVFTSVNQAPIVPDMFLSLDVEVPKDLWVKEHRSYFLWEYDKPPEVVVEIVSNKKGGETDKKLRRYARLGVWYYVIFDPQRLVQQDLLQVYQCSIGRYTEKRDLFLDQIGLGLSLWEGIFEGTHEQWIRWCDEDGHLLPIASEQLYHEQQNTEQERQRADTEQQRAERLAAQLRALGIEPEQA